MTQLRAHMSGPAGGLALRRSLRAGWVLALASGAVVAAVEIIIFFRFTVDDALISLRYARNLANGLGLVYNPGERVEGFSNPLLVFLAAAAFRTGIDGLLFAKVLGLAAYAAVLILLLHRIRTLSRANGTQDASVVLYAVPLTILAPSFGLTFYASTGLETVLVGALLLVVVMSAASSPYSLLPWLGLIPLAMTRPEAPAYVLVPAAAAWLWRPAPGVAGDRAPSWRRWLGPALFALAVLVALLARLSYYGELVPNTFYAKTPWNFTAWLPDQRGRGLISLGTWPLRGFDDMVDFARATGIVLLVVVLALYPSSLRLTRQAKLALVAMGIGLAFQKWAGGDWMFGARFLVPLIPMAGLLWIEVLAPWARRTMETSTLSAAGIIAAVLMVLTHANDTLTFMQGTDFRHAQMTGQTLTPLGQWIGDHAPQNWLMSSGAIGAAGYYGGCRIVDYQGLVSRDIAKLRAASAPDSIRRYLERLKPDMIMDESLAAPQRIERPYGTYVKLHESRGAGYAAQVYVRQDRVGALRGMPSPPPAAAAAAAAAAAPR